MSKPERAGFSLLSRARRGVGLALFSGALFTLAPSGADAASGGTPGPGEVARQRDAQARYERGVQAYSAGRYREAVARFLEADAVLPSAPLSYNIALAYENLSDVAGALRFYRDYLRRAPGADNAADVQRRVADLERQLAARGVQQITVRSDPPGATVFVDDRPLGITPWTGELAPGAYRLALVLPDHAPAERKVRLTATRSLDVNLVLATGPDTVLAGAAPPAAAEPSPAAPSPRGPRTEREARGFGPWPWVTLGAGGAALAAAGVFELRRRSVEDDARREGENQIDYSAKLEEAEAHQLTARILAGVGGALVITGGALVLFAPERRDEPEPAPRAAFGCLPGSGCFGSVRTTF